MLVAEQVTGLLKIHFPVIFVDTVILYYSIYFVHAREGHDFLLLQEVKLKHIRGIQIHQREDLL